MSHLGVVLVGLFVLQLVSSGVLALTVAWSSTEPAGAGRVLASGLAYLPAELVVGAAAFALFGVSPRALPLAWAGYAGTTFIAFLGPGLKLPSWVLDLAPVTHVGNPPLGTVHGGSLVVLTALAVTLAVVAAVAFTRRGIPVG